MLAICVIVNVSAIYLAQPLLPFIGDTLGAGTGAMSAVQALLQLAFGSGLVVFGILADTRDRRALMTAMACGLTLAAALAAAAPGYAVFLGASLVMGACAAVLPVVIATAAAARDRRALTAVLSAAPLGVVVGRTLAGLLGQIDWRLAFALAAVAAAGSVVLLRRALPEQARPAGGTRVLAAVREMGGLLRLPGNVVILASNALPFLGWSAVWTILAFLLKEAPFDMGALQIGLVGLVALGGVIAGPVGARLAGAVGDAAAARACLVASTLAGISLAAAARSLPLLLASLFVHNAGIWVQQAVNIPATARRVGPGRAARGTALLYLTNFLATAAGALLGAVVWDAAGWRGIGLMAAASCLAGLALDLAGRGAAARGAEPGAAGAPSD